MCLVARRETAGSTDCDKKIKCLEGNKARHLTTILLTTVGVAQLVERWTVTPEVAGSNPVAHPTFQQSTYAAEM